MENKGFNALKEKIIREYRLENIRRNRKLLMEMLWILFGCFISTLAGGGFYFIMAISDPTHHTYPVIMGIAAGVWCAMFIPDACVFWLRGQNKKKEGEN